MHKITCNSCDFWWIFLSNIDTILSRGHQKLPQLTILQVSQAGYWVKFSTSNNHVSVKLHRLWYCLCTRMTIEPMCWMSTEDNTNVSYGELKIGEYKSENAANEVPRAVNAILGFKDAAESEWNKVTSSIGQVTTCLLGIENAGHTDFNPRKLFITM